MDETGPEIPPKSKTRLKREMEALQELGEELVRLSPARLSALELPEVLREAVVAARNITAHGGRRRQLQYIGRLMRDVDAEAIRLALQATDRPRGQPEPTPQPALAWRDRLVAGGDSALNELLQEYPGGDRQRLRQLARSARGKGGSGDKRAAARLLACLRELIED